jgi:hypothetical protein
MYAGDNNDRLVYNNSHGAGEPTGWVMGWLPTPQDATNVNLLKQGLLWEYNKSLPTYKCPADQSTATEADGKHYPRVRSISMNGNMNGNSWYTATIDSTYFTYRKYSDIVRPAPAQAFVFLDEHPDDIDDGYFLVNLTVHAAWGNMPANYHNGACGFSFGRTMFPGYSFELPPLRTRTCPIRHDARTRAAGRPDSAIAGSSRSFSSDATSGPRWCMIGTIRANAVVQPVV